MAVKLDVLLAEFSESELSERFGEIKEDWADTLTAKVQKVWDNLHAKIPDENAYKERLAIPSYSNFYDFVNPNFPRSRKAILKQRFGVLAGASYFLTNVYYAIGLDQRFSDGVRSNKDKFESRVKLIWRITGDNDKQVGLLQKLAMALEGDVVKLQEYISGDDQVATLEPDCPPMFQIEYLSMCVSAIIIKFTEVYRMARLIQQAGEDWTDIVNEFNTFAETLKNTFANPNIDPSQSAIQMGYLEGQDKFAVGVRIATPE